MVHDPWLPIGFTLQGDAKTGRVLFSGTDWQIVEAGANARALVCKGGLAARWRSDGLVNEAALTSCAFGLDEVYVLKSSSGAILAPVQDCRLARSFEDALAFAQAIGQTRAISQTAPLCDGLFCETLTRILPTYASGQQEADELLLGKWLTGGLPIPAGDITRLSKATPWLEKRRIYEILSVANIPVREINVALDRDGRSGAVVSASDAGGPHLKAGARFQLPGRAELEAFFQDHVVDIVQNAERYRALGISNPPAIILNGPPGCGKTFAVEKLIEFLDWPNFSIDASSIASPYIHETSRKIAETFDAAVDAAPSVVVIDEMEAFAGDRSGGGGSYQHRLEELSEFLKRIPAATKAGVLVVGMTNRLDLIDPAILRRGRFDQILNVGFATAIEIEAMLRNESARIPKSADVDFASLARELEGRPLSDVSFVLREGARLAAKAGNAQLRQIDLRSALESAAPRGENAQRRIGF